MRVTSRRGNVVMDLSAGTCSTTKTRMLLDRPRRFLECSVDAELMPAAEKDRAVSLSSQVLDPKSNISGTENE